MTQTVLFHPASTFFAGLIMAVVGILVLLTSCAAPNRSAAAVEDYKKAVEKVPSSGLTAGSAAERAALERFKSFLKGIGDVDYVRENVRKAYSQDAWLDDTLVVHSGVEAIEKYFIQTSETVTSYELTIDDVARSGDDYYVRWTMIFAAPALSGGEPCHSVGVSQVRFDREGKVALHKDFWDSGKNFYGHLPVIGGGIGYVGKRLESN